ncbi:MAG: transcription-repair coupling factor [Candidatus Loosdrechtia sp.]|uniref:transcription-repair coupling factor n=1 Tax=Candidatus Loosdrechtia sp. TaxID=3101272 RepID=UPI003A74E105|nr:MAG: transcription-repair coupling factor [Candidatus Jettenia sp. AMX2]
MKNVISLLKQNRQYKRILSHLSAGKDCFINGLWGSSANFVIAALASERFKRVKKCPGILLVVASIEEALDDYEDLTTFIGGHASLFPATESFIMEDEYDSIAQKVLILKQIFYRDTNLQNKPDIVVVPVQALLQPVPSPASISENSLHIRKNQEYPREELIAWLQDHQYRMSTQVEDAGEYALRGGIVDIFPYASEFPYRIEYFGDEVESIRKFDIESQLSEKDLDTCQILSLDRIFGSTQPLVGSSPDSSHSRGKAAKINNNPKVSACPSEPQKTSLLRYLPAGTWIVLKEPACIEERAKKVLSNFGTNDALFTVDEIFEQFATFTKINISRLPVTFNNGDYTFHVKSADGFPQNIEGIVTELGKITETNGNTVVVCNNVAEKQRFHEIIDDSPLKDHERLKLCTGHLHKGFQFSDINIAILAHHEIFHRYQQRREVKKPVQARAIDSFLELKKGDYVVHIAHGIGRFLGMETLEDEGHKREYLVLEFDEGTKVYVPAAKIELVQKYIGSSDSRPVLDKIGSRYWEVRKKRVENAVKDVASDLLHIQALRNVKDGIAYPPDTEWQKEFEASFLYEETADQLQIIEDVKRDMESKRPMDRLICGDVGYGKTEIAMRAAFKAVIHGKQVAVLVPTTILAQQHYNTFSERMADYPVKTEVLSRFKSKKEQKDILEKTSAGLVDILIGTHRLLQKDVYFKDIGLIIIDEEQRFGVEHKERLKRLRQTVDVLTLTATPIPRTLHMSLMGIKDISSLNTPPLGRQAIHTRIIRFNPQQIRQAILYELNREGQVYFVHNRVYNIEQIAKTLSGIVPEARIAIVHGQMDEKLMEQRMRGFINHQADILVCTTIIESGLDIPNVNTIVINGADTFGLADLHQLRGRVGRYKHRAYAYILLPDDRPVTPEAERRIKAIEEFAELGAGFRIAMRDLEIRGAGSILGTEQHGHIAAVGYEMYCRLLEIAVRKAKHEQYEEPPEVTIDLKLESFIPGNYIREDALKMDIYRRLNRSVTLEEIRAIAGEITDRFGGLPYPVRNLLSESELRVIARHSKIRSLVRVDNLLIIKVTDLKKAEKCLGNFEKYIRIINENTLHMRLPKKAIHSSEDLLDFLRL